MTLVLSIGRAFPGLKARLKKVLPTWFHERQKNRRGRKFASRLEDVERALAARSEVVAIECPLGVGNVGVVYRARLGDGWEKALGIGWRSGLAVEGAVALKIAGPSSPKERMETLVPFAREIEAACTATPPLPLCPWIAMGLLRTEADEYLVEVMPIVEGRSLRAALEEGKGTLPGAGTMSQLAAILETVRFFERCGYYTRNLDADNVMVEPGGRWVRIDFDNAEPCANFPFRRMKRLTALAGVVLEALEPGTPETEARRAGLAGRIAATQKALARGESATGGGDSGVLETPEDLLEEVRTLAGQGGPGFALR